MWKYRKRDIILLSTLFIMIFIMAYDLYMEVDYTAAIKTNICITYSKDCDLSYIGYGGYSWQYIGGFGDYLTSWPYLPYSVIHPDDRKILRYIEGYKDTPYFYPFSIKDMDFTISIYRLDGDKYHKVIWFISNLYQYVKKLPDGIYLLTERQNSEYISLNDKELRVPGFNRSYSILEKRGRNISIVWFSYRYNVISTYLKVRIHVLPLFYVLARIVSALLTPIFLTIMAYISGLKKDKRLISIILLILTIYIYLLPSKINFQDYMLYVKTLYLYTPPYAEPRMEFHPHKIIYNTSGLCGVRLLIRLSPGEEYKLINCVNQKVLQYFMLFAEKFGKKIVYIIPDIDVEIINADKRDNYYIVSLEDIPNIKIRSKSTVSEDIIIFMGINLKVNAILNE